MKSAIAVTYELDDAIEAARELADSIKEKITLQANSIGILFCDADTDSAAVTSELKDMLGIEIAGMSTLAVVSHEGYHQSAAVLTVMTADDCTFTAAASQKLTKDNYEQKIIEAYNSTIPENAGDDYKPGVLYAFCPNGISFSADKYPEILSKQTGNAPIIGGVASDDYEYVSACVFLSGTQYKDAMVLVNISGNVKPLFSIQHVTSRFAERIRRVTSATNNTVHTVGDETFVEYLQGFGLKTDVPDVLLAFNPYPMMLTQDDDGDVPLMRHITGLDLETGSGSCVGDVPVGAKANICLLNKNDLVTSCRESLEMLLEKAKRENAQYEYSTVLCITCCGRALLLGADSSAEGDVIKEMLPQNLNLSGAYCFGEICPTRYNNGEAVNKFHNCSITFCLI